MTRQALATLISQVDQLYADLDQVIAQERWGGAATYIGFYNRFLAQAKVLWPDLPFDLFPEVQQSKREFPDRSMEQKQLDREALLALRPLCGQFKVWLAHC
ncbi:MAG: hypothetical protein NTU85_03560 [Candidatus Kaiserbacteria bacterium]|nr:hypothetical protein [Candidatus Kaiserbacteria bacterium]